MESEHITGTVSGIGVSIAKETATKYKDYIERTGIDMSHPDASHAAYLLRLTSKFQAQYIDTVPPENVQKAIETEKQKLIRYAHQGVIPVEALSKIGVDPADSQYGFVFDPNKERNHSLEGQDFFGWETDCNYYQE